MAVGGGVRTAKPPLEKGGEPRIATVMTARISCDRRVGDEALALLRRGREARAEELD